MKISRNELKKEYKNIIKANYCELYYLLYFKNAKFQNYGIYGWNYDVYDLKKAAIVTGYRPFGTIENHEICKKYNNLAKKIVESFDNNEQKVKKINKLLENFINELIGGKNEA